MDLGTIAFAMIMLLLSAYAWQRAKEQGVKPKKWQIAIIIISGLLIGFIPLWYFLWNMCFQPLIGRC